MLQIKECKLCLKNVQKITKLFKKLSKIVKLQILSLKNSLLRRYLLLFHHPEKVVMTKKHRRDATVCKNIKTPFVNSSPKITGKFIVKKTKNVRRDEQSEVRMYEMILYYIASNVALFC